VELEFWANECAQTDINNKTQLLKTSSQRTTFCVYKAYTDQWARQKKKLYIYIYIYIYID